eukprot:90079_1
MGNLNNKCLSSGKSTDLPIICEIFNDTGTYITSCFSHDTIAYIKQCYVESCDPPPLPKNIIFKLLVNPTFNSLKPTALAIPTLTTEASKSSSHAFSYVSNSHNSTLQKVILLDDTDIMAKYKRYSLSMQKYSNNCKDKDNEPKRLIFQIRIEHISSKHKQRLRLNKAQLDRKRSDSTSTTINTNTMRQMYQNTGNMTPSDAYSVVSVESTASFNFATHLNDISHKKFTRKSNNKKGEKRKKYKRRRKIMKSDYAIPITDINELIEEDNDEQQTHKDEEKSNIPLMKKEDDDSAALDQFETMITNELKQQKKRCNESEEDIDSRTDTQQDEEAEEVRSPDNLNRPSKSVQSMSTNDDEDTKSVRIIRRIHKKKECSQSHSHYDVHSPQSMLSPSQNDIKSPLNHHHKSAETVTPEHPLIAIGLVSSSSDVDCGDTESEEEEDSRGSRMSRNSIKRETNIIRSDRSRRERKRSNSFGVGEVFPLSLIYGENNAQEDGQEEGSVSYYHEHSYDNAMKFSLRKVNRRRLNVSRRKATKKKKKKNAAHAYGHSYSDREFSMNSQYSFADLHFDDDLFVRRGVKLSLSTDSELSSSPNNERICHQASQPPPEPHDSDGDPEFGAQSMRLDVFHLKGGQPKFKRVRNLKDDIESKKKTKARRSRQIHRSSNKKKKKKKKPRKEKKKMRKISADNMKRRKSKPIKRRSIKHHRRKISTSSRSVASHSQSEEEEEEDDDDAKDEMMDASLTTVTTTFERIEEKLETGMIEPGSTQYQRELDDAMHKLKRKHEKLAHRASQNDSHKRKKKKERTRHRSASHNHKCVRNISHQSLPPLYDEKNNNHRRYNSSSSCKRKKLKVFRNEEEEADRSRRRRIKRIEDKKQLKQNKPHSKRKEGQPHSSSFSMY